MHTRKRISVGHRAESRGEENKGRQNYDLVSGGDDLLGRGLHRMRTRGFEHRAYDIGGNLEAMPEGMSFIFAS